MPNNRTKQHKSLTLGADVKLTGEDPGRIEGYGSVFYNVDDGGDIVIKGAYADTLEDFLKNGFAPDTHEWTYATVHGYPVEATEDDYGLKLAIEFHTTQKAQDQRTIARERMEAGKTVSFSIGYWVEESEVIPRKEYEERLPEFIPADKMDDVLAQAKKRVSVRVLKKVHLAEVSFVPRPMNREATATSVKSASPDEAKSEYLGEWMEYWMTMSGAVAVLDELYWKVLDTVYGVGDERHDEMVKEMHAAFTEGGELIGKMIEALLVDDALDTEKAAEAFIEKYGNPDNEEARRAGLPYEARKAIALDAVASAIDDTHDIFTKSREDKQAVSASRQQKLVAFIERLEQQLKRARDLSESAAASSPDAEANAAARKVFNELITQQFSPDNAGTTHERAGAEA